MVLGLVEHHKSYTIHHIHTTHCYHSHTALSQTIRHHISQIAYQDHITTHHHPSPTIHHPLITVHQHTHTYTTHHPPARTPSTLSTKSQSHQ
ncbi:hypothetical protein EON63_19005 [archaeon]|nr:MAG: hypothetical protein EON63_19005 [archaeon]